MGAELDVSDLSGQVAIVTGGGRGLGHAFAQSLASAGAAVAVIARSPEQLQATVNLIRTEGGRCTVVHGTLDQPETRIDFDDSMI